MIKAGTRVDCSELKSQLNSLRAKEISPEGASSSTTVGNSLKIGFQYPIPPNSVPSKSTNELHAQNKDDPKIQPIDQKTTQPTKPKDWAALFHTQSRSSVMKLSHYPELQKGEDAVVELDDIHVMIGPGNNCLIVTF